MLMRLSSPPVIYHDLVMEKLHFPDTGVGIGPVIPAPQALPLLEMVPNLGCIGRSGGSHWLPPA